ncbi:MAG: type II toxin-antitoxin system VapC family toxin [Acidimicrobiales bacterium]
MIDASAVVALLVDAGPAGRWVTASVSGTTLAAPQLIMFEAANVLRRHSLAGLLDQTQATLAHADLLSLPLQLWPYAPLAERAWQLRRNFTAYDAVYLALAELLGGSMITLDTRIASAPGAACPILTYRPAES